MDPFGFEEKVSKSLYLSTPPFFTTQLSLFAGIWLSAWLGVGDDVSFGLYFQFYPLGQIETVTGQPCYMRIQPIKGTEACSPEQHLV